MRIRFMESAVEHAARGWIESLGWAVNGGPGIAPATPSAEQIVERAC